MGEELFQLFAHWRIARRVEDLDEETIKAIAAASVPVEYNALDLLIEDWAP